MTYSASKSYVFKWKLRKFTRRILSVGRPARSAGKPGTTRFNRILDNQAREEYRESIETLFRLAPKIMERKIPEANVQQAFVLDSVQKFSHDLPSPRLLCVGCFEDTAAESLEKMGYKVDGIDPVLNHSLDGFYTRYPKRKNYYDIVFSTSVIEHVENDELFLNQIASLLKPGGVAILTVDFNDQYQPGDPIPQEDYRMYTQKDFFDRIMPLLADCALVDEPQWECQKPDFMYADYKYTFATFVFRKNSL